MDRRQRYTLLVGFLLLVMVGPSYFIYLHFKPRSQWEVVHAEQSHFARHQAAYDHKCPFEQVEVIGHNHDWTRCILNVCGQWYKYRRVDNVWGDDHEMYLRELKRRGLQ